MAPEGRYIIMATPNIHPYPENANLVVPLHKQKYSVHGLTSLSIVLHL